MTRTAYHRPLDLPVAAFDVVRAEHLQPGDQIVQPGFITLTVIGMREYREHRLVAADYDCAAGLGSRTFVASERVKIAPRAISETEMQCRAMGCNCSHGPHQHAAWCAVERPARRCNCEYKGAIGEQHAAWCGAHSKVTA